MADGTGKLLLDWQIWFWFNVSAANIFIHVGTELSLLGIVKGQTPVLVGFKPVTLLLRLRGMDGRDVYLVDNKQVILVFYTI